MIMLQTLDQWISKQETGSLMDIIKYNAGARMHNG